MTAREEQVLRAVTYRISAATQQELPAIVRAATPQLLDCRGLLLSNASTKKAATDNVVLHKFKTQLTTSLSGKTLEGRWAGTVLIKATVELGGYEILTTSGGWVRSLLHNLNKPDPASSKKLAILSLTRIFELTHGYQSLVRELTTPSLKDYISITLSLIQPRANRRPSASSGLDDQDLLATILQSYARLLPSHPSIFRSHMTQIQNLLLPLVGTSSTIYSSRSVQAAASKLFPLLHHCTPKTNNNSPSDSYVKALVSVIRSTHVTCSLVFRSIIEDWSPLPGNEIPKVEIPVEVDLKPSNSSDDPQMPSWTGIDEGCQRLKDLISLLCSFLKTATSGQISFPLAAFVDLIFRICNTTVPPVASGSKGRSARASIPINDQVSQQEREVLFNELPSIHASAVNLISALVERLGSASKPVQGILLEQVVWVFKREKYNVALRTACYAAMSALLGASAAGFARDSVRQCVPLLNSCCDDLLPTTMPTSKHDTNGQLSADVIMGKSSSSPILHELVGQSPLVTAAEELLVISHRAVPPLHLSQTLRARLDRAAILSQNKDAMLASTINSAPKRPDAPHAAPSLMPFLAQQNPADLAVEGLLRPRMPAVRAQDSGIQYERDGAATDGYDSSEHDKSDDDDEAEHGLDEQNVENAEVEMGEDGVRNGLEEMLPVASNVHDNEQAASRKRSPDPRELGEAKKIRLDEAAETVPHLQVPPQPTTGSALAPQPTILPDTTTASTADHETVATMPAPVKEVVDTSETRPSDPQKKKFDVESDTDESEFEIPKIHMPDSDEEEEEDG